jgi:hypothetical protein
MGPILDAAEQFFKEDDWPYSTTDDPTTLRLGFQGQNGEWNCYARAREEQGQLLFYSVCPFRVPDERRAAVAEFLTRANYGLLVSNFEMDYADGEVRCRSSVSVEGARLPIVMIRPIVLGNVLITDRYLPGLLAVIDEGKAPAEAIAGIEN